MIAPAMILLAVALWVLLPLWLIVVAALVPVLPGPLAPAAPPLAARRLA